MSLELGYQGIGLALECEPAPKQTNADGEGEVNATVAKIGPVSGGAAKGKLKVDYKDLVTFPLCYTTANEVNSWAVWVRS